MFLFEVAMLLSKCIVYAQHLKTKAMEEGKVMERNKVWGIFSRATTAQVC